jgi:flagellar biosynthesis protein FliR
MTLLVWYFCLVMARVATFVAVVPLLGGTTLPRSVKAGLTLALTMVWYVPLAEEVSAAAMMRGSFDMPWWGCLLAVGREVFLGGLLGYGLGLFLVPVHVAGEFIAQEMGLAFGSQVNPLGNASSSPLTQIMELLATALFFGADGHHIMLGMLHATFVQYPLTGAALLDVPLPRLVAGATMAQEWGLMLAAPVALCLFLTTILLALLTRAAPHMNLHSIGFPLRLGVGLTASLLLMPSWVAAVVNAFAQFKELASQMM